LSSISLLKYSITLGKTSLDETNLDTSAPEKTSEISLLLDIRKMGISLIGAKNGVTIEPIYVFFEGLEIFYKLTEKNTEYQLRVKSMNIDNNSTQFTTFPVLLTPSNPDQLRKNHQTYFLNFSINKKNASTDNLLMFEEIALDLQPLTFSIDETLINLLWDILDSIKVVTETKSETDYLHKYFCIHSESTNPQRPKTDETDLYKYSQPQPEWLTKEPAFSKYWIYVDT
jgi:hypothetical protein